MTYSDEQIRAAIAEMRDGGELLPSEQLAALTPAQRELYREALGRMEFEELKRQTREWLDGPPGVPQPEGVWAWTWVDPDAELRDLDRLTEETTVMTEDPLLRRAHLLAAGLLDHHRAGAPDTMAALLASTVDESTDPPLVAAQYRMLVLALIELASAGIDDQPDDPAAWLSERQRHFRDREA